MEATVNPLDEELGRAPDPDNEGKELVLCRREGGFVVLREGQVVLDSAARRSEQELVRLGLGPLRDRTDITVLLAGLGMGHTLRALLDDERVVRVDVVEQSAALIDWNRTHLQVLHREPPLADPRVHVHHADFLAFIQKVQAGGVEGLVQENNGYFLSIVLDLDNGPSGLSRPGNAAIYSDEGLGQIAEVLRPGGVLALWSAQRETEFIGRVRHLFQNVGEMVVPVDLPDHGLDYIYRCRRGALPRPAVSGSSNGHAQSN